MLLSTFSYTLKTGCVEIVHNTYVSPYLHSIVLQDDNKVCKLGRPKIRKQEPCWKIILFIT